MSGAPSGIAGVCLEGTSPFDFPGIPVHDGENHPAETGEGTRIVGTLRFLRADRGSTQLPSRVRSLLPAAEKSRNGTWQGAC